MFPGNSAVNKLLPRFSGPYRILSVNDNKITYTIENISDNTVISAHHTQLAVCKEPPDYLVNERDFPRAMVEEESADESSSIPANSLCSSGNSECTSLSSLSIFDDSASFHGFQQLVVVESTQMIETVPAGRDAASLAMSCDDSIATHVCLEGSSAFNEEVELSDVTLRDLNDYWEHPSVAELSPIST